MNEDKYVVKPLTTFSHRGGFPLIGKDEQGYYKQVLYCDICKKPVSEYDRAMGLILPEGYYCKVCGGKIESIAYYELTEEEFHKENEALTERMRCAGVKI